MEFIKEWLIAIMGASVLAIAAEMLMPESEIKKYTALAVGIIMISIIAEPILRFDKTVLLINERIFKEQIAAEESSSGIETVEWRRLDEEFSDRLTDLAVGALGSGYENLKLTAELSYDRIERITVSGYSADQAAEIEKVLNTFGAVEIIWSGSED